MPRVPPSTKEQIVRVAERLFSAHGLDGVSLRQIGAASGNGNHSAVSYHFGSKAALVQAIFESRLPDLHERRRLLTAQRRPRDLRGWVECYVLPILEQGEQQGSQYLSFVAMLQQSDEWRLFERIPDEFREATRVFRDEISSRICHVPEPLRTHRISQAMTFGVHAAADRERAQATGRPVLPFAVHVYDLLDGLIGFLEAPVSGDTVDALVEVEPVAFAWPVLL